MTNIVTVLIVDDSAYNRKVLSEMLSCPSMVKVIGTANDGEDAIKKALALKPDVITLDLEMPKMDGFTFLRIMMNRFPTPTIVISSRSGDTDVFKALELGAVNFIAKPSRAISADLLKIKEELLGKVCEAGNIRMERVKVDHLYQTDKRIAKKNSAPSKIKELPLVAIGASTGGPSSLQKVLSMIPADIPAAIAISQHMPAGFTKTFAERLNKLLPLNVKEAENGDILKTGSVIIAPGGFNLAFERNDGFVKAILIKGDDKDKYVPSVTRMFLSAAQIFGSNTIAVVMTGMGDDGKDGVIKIKEAGGRTIAQSEDTSIIFGMPKEAILTGKIDMVLPLEGIAEGIISICREDGRLK